MEGDDITVPVEQLARRLTQQQEDAAATERLARRLTQQQEDAAATEQHRIMVNTLVRVSRVPEHVRYHYADAYTPGLVAIGPLHAGNRRLRAGTRLKMSYLNSLISRGHPDPASHLTVIQNYVRLVAVREREARAMYAAEDVDISAEDFIQMMVLDGCFIIEHLVNVATGVDEASLHATPFGPVQLSVDLVLAENQIPFFVLVDLIKSTSWLPEFDCTGYQPTDRLMKLVLYYLGGEKARDMSERLPAANDVCHILHLLHAMVTAARTGWEPPPRLQDAAPVEMMLEAARYPLLLLVPLLYPILPEESRGRATRTQTFRRWRASLHASYGRETCLPPASDLKLMGVRFKKAPGGSTGKVPAGIASVLGPVPLAVKLPHEDQLRLPQLWIDFRTAPLLLNLMAFEQSADQRAGDVSAYVWLMAMLVQSQEDAGVLVAADVVASSGSESNEDVARFFKRVGAASEAAVELDRSYLGETVHKLRMRSEDPLFIPLFLMWADVKGYFINVPWRLGVLFFTIVQTMASILQIMASLKQNT